MKHTFWNHILKWFWWCGDKPSPSGVQQQHRVAPSSQSRRHSYLHLLSLVGRRRLGLASSINIRSSLNKAQSYPNCRAVSFRAASLHTGDPAHSSRSFFSQPSASQQPPPPFAEGGLSCCCTSASSHMGISCSSLKTAHHHLWLGWQPTICLCQDNTIHKRT